MKKKRIFTLFSAIFATFLIVSCQQESSSSLPFDEDFVSRLAEKYKTSDYLNDGWYDVHTTMSRIYDEPMNHALTSYEATHEAYFQGYLSFSRYNLDNIYNQITSQIFATSDAFRLIERSGVVYPNSSDMFLTKFEYFANGKYYSDMEISYLRPTDIEATGEPPGVEYSEGLEPFRISFQDFRYLHPSEVKTSTPKNLMVEKNTLTMFSDFLQGDFSFKQRHQWVFDENLNFKAFTYTSVRHQMGETVFSTTKVSVRDSVAIYVPTPIHYGEVIYAQYNGDGRIRL